MVSLSSGIEGGRGWATPACLVFSVNGLVQIPVTNADNRGCRWKDLRGKIEVSEFKEDLEVLCKGREAHIIAALGKLSQSGCGRGLFFKRKGLTHLVEHHIVTGNARPVRPNPARVSPPERRLIKNLAQAMMDDDVVEHSNSLSLVLKSGPCPKPNGSGIRFCGDYRGIYKVTVQDVHPLPVMDDLIGQLDGATIHPLI